MFFKLSRFQYFLALPFLSDLLLNSLGVWLSAHNPSSWLSKNMCVCVCFFSCLLSLHLSFVWNYSYYTSTELLARYKCMWISLFTSICLPNVFRKNSPSPHFSHKNICNSLLCDDLLRKLQRGVCIFSFSFCTTCMEVIMYTQTL